MTIDLKIQTAEMEVSEMEERKIGQIKEELKAATETMLPSFIAAYEPDERSGVRKLVEQAKKRLQKLEEERKRIWNLQEEDRLPVLLLQGQ